MATTPARFSGGPWDGQIKHLPPATPSWCVPLPPQQEVDPLFQTDFTVGEYYYEAALSDLGERVFVWTEIG